MNARWGYSRALLAYELWNEVDAPGMVWGEGRHYATEAASVRSWHAAMSGFLESRDPYGHLVTTSFADSRLDPALWASPGMDLTTIHRYTYYNPEYGDVQFATVPTLQGIISVRRYEATKPVIVGEFALSPGGDIQRMRDPQGIEFHKQLWASVMAKSAATAMHWTWGSYVHARDLYRHYGPLAAFFDGVDLRGTTPLVVADPGAPVHLAGLKTARRAYLWAYDPRWTFAEVEGGYVPPDLRGARIDVELASGAYDVQYVDTQTGRALPLVRAESVGGVLALSLPPCSGDVAIRIEPAWP